MKALLRALVGSILISFALTADDGSFLWTHKKKLGALAAVVSHVMLRRSSCEYKEATDKARERAKEFLIHNVVVPVLTKVEHVKHNGLSQHDIVRGGALLTILTAIGAHLKLYKADTALTKELILKDLKYLNEHRVFAGSSAFLIGASIVAYIEGLDLPHIQQFLLSLSRRQKKAIASSEQMSALLDNAHDDPKALLDHDPLQELLHDHQKELLDKAVQEQIIHNDPLSLLDDLDF